MSITIPFKKKSHPHSTYSISLALLLYHSAPTKSIPYRKKKSAVPKTTLSFQTFSIIYIRRTSDNSPSISCSPCPLPNTPSRRNPVLFLRRNRGI